MKSIKKLFCAALACAVAVSMFAGCHKKEEIGVTVTDSKITSDAGKAEFTSAYYSCALIMSFNSAKSEVYQKYQSDADKLSSGIDYFKETVDGKKFSDYVIDLTEESLKKIAAYKIKCAENKITLTDEEKSAAEQYAESYWNNEQYKYSDYFEPNGVSLDTYKAYMTDTYYASRYFDFLYAEGGEKAIDDATITDTMKKNYMICDVLDVSFDNLTDEEKAAKKTFVNQALSDINSGRKKYAQVFAEYNSTDEVAKENTTDSSAPRDSLADIIGTSDTNYNTYAEYFEQLSGVAAGKATLIEKGNDGGLLLFVKGDIMADPYYKTYLDSEIRSLVSGDQFTKDMEAYAKKLKISVKKSTARQFTPKKITEPDSSAS